MKYPPGFAVFRCVGREFGRIGVAIALIATVLGVGLSIASPAAEAAVTRPFSPSSFWNTPLPSSTPTDPRSSIWAADIQDQISDYYGTVAVNTSTYSPPVFIAAPGTPTTAVKFLNCQNKSWVDPNFLTQVSAVPIPDNAVASAGTDKELVIWQPSTDQLWELWKAEKRADGWYACWGGRLQNVSTSNGVFAQYYGVAASGLSLLGGLMRIEELQQGRIDHAISVALVRTRSSVFSWPANRTDGWINDANAIPEGQRFRLDPALNVDALNLTPVGKMVAKAMQTYGMVIRDTSGAVAIYGENPQPLINAGQANPYNDIFQGKASYRIMDGFPWNRLQALPFDYGKNGVQEPGTPYASYINSTGYRALTANGDVTAFGSISSLGGASTSSAVSMTSTCTRAGYWITSSSGAVSALGDATNYGSMAGKKLNAPVVGMAARSDSSGYYLLGSDGGVFSFGDAPFYGSTGGKRLNQPVVGMATAPRGNGYWFVASDGGVFSYGPDAKFYGSMGGKPLNRPIVGMAATPSGEGYWLVASDGGVFAFGDARFYGSTGNIKLNKPIVGLTPTVSGAGYRFIASDGGVFSYGDAVFHGSLASASLPTPVVALSN